MITFFVLAWHNRLIFFFCVLSFLALRHVVRIDIKEAHSQLTCNSALFLVRTILGNIRPCSHMGYIPPDAQDGTQSHHSFLAPCLWPPLANPMFCQARSLSTPHIRLPSSFPYLCQALAFSRPDDWHCVGPSLQLFLGTALTVIFLQPFPSLQCFILQCLTARRVRAALSHYWWILKCQDHWRKLSLRMWHLSHVTTSPLPLERRGYIQ